jgi:hypothetical protein
MQQEDISLILYDLERLTTIFRENYHGEPWKRQVPISCTNYKKHMYQ